MIFCLWFSSEILDSILFSNIVKITHVQQLGSGLRIINHRLFGKYVFNFRTNRTILAMIVKPIFSLKFWDLLNEMFPVFLKVRIRTILFHYFILKRKVKFYTLWKETLWDSLIHLFIYLIYSEQWSCAEYRSVRVSVLRRCRLVALTGPE